MRIFFGSCCAMLFLYAVDNEWISLKLATGLAGGYAILMAFVIEHRLKKLGSVLDRHAKKLFSDPIPTRNYR